MNICFITSTYPDIRCGVGLHTYYLAEQLVQQGHRVTVLTSHHRALRNTPQPHVIPFTSSWQPHVLVALASHIRKLQPDIIHVQYPTAIRHLITHTILIAVLRIRFSHIPVVLTLHEYTEASTLGRLRNGIMLATARYAILPNPNDSAVIARWPRWLAPQTISIPIGPTLPLIPHDDLHVRPYRLVTWGLIDEKKLTRELIQGFARVAKHFPDSSLAILSGLHPHDNEYHRAVTEDITRLNLDTQVEWHHEVNDDALVHELTTAHVAVLLYKDGATWRRSTLIEAFTAGVPVITTKSHLTPPDLIDAHAATLIPPNPTPDTLAEAITTLFTDSAYAAANQRKGYTIAQRFSWKMIATETTRFYERILRNSGSRSQPDQ